MGPWNGIIAITRGGLVPAAILAREIDCRLIDTVCVSRYDPQSQREERVLQGVEGAGEGWLNVDDLVDTGKTARVVREMLPEEQVDPCKAPHPRRRQGGYCVPQWSKYN